MHCFKKRIEETVNHFYYNDTKNKKKEKLQQSKSLRITVYKIILQHNKL